MVTCQVEGKSPKTISWYRAFLLKFLTYLEANQFSTDLGEITRDQVRAYIRYLQIEAKNPRNGKPLSGATVQGCVRTLKVFFSWAVREEYIPINRFSGVRVPKAQTKIINTFSPEQVKALLQCCRESNKNGSRNSAIILLLFDTGIRVSELVNIDVDDVNLNEGTIKIRVAKGGKERMVPIGSLVQKALIKYIHFSRPKPLTQQITKLFLNASVMPLGANGIQILLRRYGKEAGLTSVRVSPHTLRHSFAKNYIMNGGDVFSLQRILGHANISTVKIYLNLFAVDIKKQHSRFSPVDTLAGTLYTKGF
jgi:integrase/recombinase XerD